MKLITLSSLLRAFLVIAILAYGVGPGKSIAQDAGGSARDQLQQNQEQKKALEKELSSMKQAESLASKELREIDGSLARIEKKLSETTRTLQRKRQQVQLLNVSHNAALEDLKKAREKFEHRLVEWYKNGNVTVFGNFGTAKDLGDFIDLIEYTDAIIESDRKTIEFIVEQQGRILKERQLLDAEIASCEKLLADMRSDEDEYASLRDKRLSKLNAIASDVDAAEAALAELEASSYEITMMLQVSHYTGKSGPLIPPINARMTSGFGMRKHPIIGRTRMHTGSDFPSPSGTPIHAAGSGYVVEAGWQRGYGNTVVIDHGGGLATLYAHCSSLLVKKGETVNRGQVIARVGSTGLSTGYHLHFEVRINGEPVDPMPYISGQ